MTEHRQDLGAGNSTELRALAKERFQASSLANFYREMVEFAEPEMRERANRRLRQCLSEGADLIAIDGVPIVGGFSISTPVEFDGKRLHGPEITCKHPEYGSLTFRVDFESAADSQDEG